MLLLCINSLGFINGFRYWRLARRAMKRPELCFEWAVNCEGRALECHGRESEEWQKWANILRSHYYQWKFNGGSGE